MTERFIDNDNNIDSKPTFEEALEELKTDDESMPSPALIVGLSDLSSEQLSQLGPVWEGLSHSYRRILMQMLVDASASNFMLNFQPIGFATLTSHHQDVRQAAIELLYENESTALLRALLAMATDDPAENVRAEAVKSLGRFALNGEMGNLDSETAEYIQETLLTIINNSQEDSLVRRFALESLANCTRKDTPQLIAKAYKSNDADMRLSAIVAMGHSCDTRWENEILEELSNTNDDHRLAAIEAAGEIQLSTAVGQIIKNIEEGERPEQSLAIVALGEIGGKEAVRVLQSLLDGAEEADDNPLLELIDDAIGTASLVNGDFMMVDYSDIDE